MSPEELFEEYLIGKQTYSQLAEKYDVSLKTIQRILDKVNIHKPSIKSREVIVLMDTTYWGRNFGVMLFRDSILKENLLKYYVKYETIKVYIEGIRELQKKGFIIKAIVCDGRPGLLNTLHEEILMQMCQFHQKQIIKRYLTSKPKMEASKELWSIVDKLNSSKKESFQNDLESWYNKWKEFYNERTKNPLTNKSFYTHKRLRSAYKSILKNLPYLFTYKEHLELNIPNTTNGIDGVFADLKNKLRNHNGLTKIRKMKLIDAHLQI